ncbi:MmyB family transcriptional regulator [Streptomyces virginiae]|uniref:MmyB family transcriptional regulator n=1 Tax=Streptomyces virginiae TaxID=1961 RepID=UPI00363E1124
MCSWCGRCADSGRTKRVRGDRPERDFAAKLRGTRVRWRRRIIHSGPHAVLPSARSPPPTASSVPTTRSPSTSVRSSAAAEWTSPAPSSWRPACQAANPRRRAGSCSGRPVGVQRLPGPTAASPAKRRAVAARVLGQCADVLAWNRLGHTLFAGHLGRCAPDLPAQRPNMARLVFLDNHPRDVVRGLHGRREEQGRPRRCLLRPRGRTRSLMSRLVPPPQAATREESLVHPFGSTASRARRPGAPLGCRP